MRFERTAGILLHPSSLPGKYGIGDLGNEAYNFINFLDSAGQKLWQVFPLGPTGYGDSPYQCFSAFAGNPLLISPDKLKDQGFLSEVDLNLNISDDPHNVDYGAVIELKNNLLKRAYHNYRQNSHGIDKEFKLFTEQNADWLENYSLFMAAKEHFNGEQWSHWDKSLVLREASALKEWGKKLEDQINYQRFVQFCFFRQWKAVKDYANEKGIMIIGDIPIFIAYDSADLWANKDLFTVDKEGKLTFVAGVPPDYFSETGQLWGNPLFKWDVMEKDNYLWWRRRISNQLQLVDIIRIDHFRGFDAYWEIPGKAKTAVKGRWVKGPGEKLFNAIKEELGVLPVIAEDLGVITKSVTALREKLQFPGMKILQFAFGTKMERKFLPHNYDQNSIVMTGSHDNDTTRAYFEKARQQSNNIYEHMQKYLNYYGEDVVFELIKAAYASAADLVVIPMQDVLNLGEDARMNFPGKLGGNWTWRFTWNMVPEDIAGKLKYLSDLYERPPIENEEVDIKVES